LRALGLEDGDPVEVVLLW